MGWCETERLPKTARPAEIVVLFQPSEGRLLVKITEPSGMVWCLSEDTARDFWGEYREAVALKFDERLGEGRQPMQLLTQREQRFVGDYLKRLHSTRRRAA